MKDARPSASRRGYSVRWRKAAATFLARGHNRMCRFGCGRLATVVDHVQPHKGDPARFWDNTNWQPLCKPCHDRTKQQIECRGYSGDVGDDGQPTDPQHPWNA